MSKIPCGHFPKCIDPDAHTPMPNEVDELEEQILKDLNHTLKLMPSNNRLAFGLEVARYITKQNKAYHAAGLRELLSRAVDIEYGENDDIVGTFIYPHIVEEAIAREESK